MFTYLTGTSADTTLRGLEPLLSVTELAEYLGIPVATRDRYAYHMRQLVLPTFANLTLREIGVARCDTLVKQLTHKSYNRARTGGPRRVTPCSRQS